MGISAVNAIKMASALGLQVQHAAVLQVKLEVGGIGVDPAGDPALARVVQGIQGSRR